MEIVKPGVKSVPPLKKSPGTCCECTCEFLFTPADVKTEMRRGLGGIYNEYHVHCPTCGIQLNVPSSHKPC